MKNTRQPIGKQLENLHRMYPHFSHETGQLFARRSATKGSFNKITLWALFVSDEDTFLLRPHLFESKHERTPRGWEGWLAEHYGEILSRDILEGINLRTNKQWKLYRIVGWVAGDNPRIKNSRVSKKRH